MMDSTIERKLFADWNAALQTRDPKIVAALYTADATFLPTVSPEFKKGQKGAEEYFHHFLEKFPDGKIVEEAAQPFGNDCIVHSGKYDFEVGPPDKREVVHARFTFVWKKEGGQWKIAHHHSSRVP